MAEPVMKYGARKGGMSMMRRWIARVSANDVRIFPVPGTDMLRLYQAETDMNALLAPNPRGANVLLVMGELTDQLAQKAGVAYQQLPRPRVLLVAGSVQPYLPEPDVQLSLGDGFLDEALPKVHQLLKDHAWSENAEPWQPDFLAEMLEDSENGGGHDHHHGHNHGKGDEDDGHHHGGGNHEEKDHHGNGGHDHNHNHDHDDEGNGYDHDQGGHKHNHSDHGSDQHGNHHDSQGNSDEDDHDHKHEGHDHSGHDHNHGEHDHADMDFMSMVAMTKDLPRPKDGLPMNRSEVHFGPFHPGLPGGLSVSMELDGDTVIKASVEGDVAARSLEVPIKVEALPDILTRFNPLAPESYRLLAQKALADAGTGKNAFSSNELVLLENERIASHLNWLATFAKTLGNEWMHQEAARWHALQRKGEVSNQKLLAFLGQVRSMPYLQTKLSVGGMIPEKLLHHLSGPVAKAAGKTADARSDSEPYQLLGWEPVNLEENNAWGRLLVRLDEIEQSLELINKVDKQGEKKNQSNFSGSGKGAAKLESPRGTLKLRVRLEDGKVNQLELETPSKPLAALVPTLTKEAELSDALVQIASLDIAPWEIKLKGAGVHQ